MLTNLCHVVDNHRNAQSQRVGQQVLEQCRLASAQKTRQHRHRQTRTRVTRLACAAGLNVGDLVRHRTQRKSGRRVVKDSGNGWSRRFLDDRVLVRSGANSTYQLNASSHSAVLQLAMQKPSEAETHPLRGMMTVTDSRTSENEILRATNPYSRCEIHREMEQLDIRPKLLNPEPRSQTCPDRQAKCNKISKHFICEYLLHRCIVETIDQASFGTILFCFKFASTE